MARTADHAKNSSNASKEVGRQLRHVRRKQGLSRAEVARSAGLTRRELAAYESGRADVPESDLWCLAGSCGVDVSELLPNRAPVKVNQDLSLLAIGDSIRYLRNPADDDEMLREYLAMIYELRNLPPGSRIPLRERDLMSLADALGGSPERIEERLVELIGMSREEAARLRAMILPSNELTAGTEPVEAADPNDLYRDLRDPQADDAVVDFFSTPRAPDVFEPPPPPGARPATDGWNESFDAPVFDPPTFAPLEPVEPAVAFDGGSFDSFDATPPPPIPLDPFAAPMPPATEAVPMADVDLAPISFMDEPPLPAWPAAPAAEVMDAPVTEWTMADAAPEAPVGDAFLSDSASASLASSPMSEPPLEPWADAEPLPRRQPLTTPPMDGIEIPEPPAVAFAAPETPIAPSEPPFEVDPILRAEPDSIVFDEPMAPIVDAPAFNEPIEFATPLAEPAAFAEPPAPVVEPFLVDEPVAYVAPEPEPEPEPAPPAPVAAAAPPPPVAYQAPPEPPAPTETIDATQPFAIPEPSAPAAVSPIAWIAREQPAANVAQGGGYQRAGSNWRVGGIFPATATADDGALALRRADARWALADLDAPGDFSVEAIVDFTAGAGFGILFRASVDESDRVSGYSFDIDPIAGGGGYLVRQWEDNRQHWRPIAQAGVTDPTLLFGRHTVTVSLRADQLTVIVDNDHVLSVPALSRSSIELGRPPCRGTRVGVQAWATTEVTVDSFSVARH